MGALSGLVTALALSLSVGDGGVSWPSLVVRALLGAQLGAATLWFVRARLRRLVRGRWRHAPDAVARYESQDTRRYLLVLLTLLSTVGVQLILPFWALLALLFAGAQLLLLRRVAPNQSPEAPDLQRMLMPLFFVSGAAALIYQVAWQRTLYVYFGVNTASVTVIVAVFMCGLGVGALLGDRLSRARAHWLPRIFIAIELGIGAFGAASLPLIRAVGESTRTASLPETVGIVFLLLAIPTLLMGATLPVLVAYLNRQRSDVRGSVSTLYFVNTLGSAAACFLTVYLLFAFGGLRAATLIAAAGNVVVALLCLRFVRRAPVVG